MSGRILLAILAVLALAWFASRSGTYTVGHAPRGTVVVTGADGAAVAVTALVREERVERVRYGRYASHFFTEPRWKLEVEGHDLATGARRWQQVLATTKVRPAVDLTRIVARDGDRVWVFADAIVALDAANGEVVVDPARLDTASPTLRGVVPRDGQFFAADPATAQLVVTAADGRRWRVDAHTLALTPAAGERPRPANAQEYDRAFAAASSASTAGATPHGFTVNGDRFADGQWLGLLSEDEARRLGRYWKYPSTPSNDPPQRRRLWRGQVRAEDRPLSGRHWELTGGGPVAGGDEFLQGGLLRNGEKLDPLRLADPDGLLVLYTDRLGSDGRYLLSRIGLDGKPRWTSALPLRRIEGLARDGDRALALTGRDRVARHEGDAHQLLVALDLRSGRCHVWDFRAEAPIAADCAASP